MSMISMVCVLSLTTIVNKRDGQCFSTDLKIVTERNVQWICASDGQTVNNGLVQIKNIFYGLAMHAQSDVIYRNLFYSTINPPIDYGFDHILSIFWWNAVPFFKDY